MFDYLSAVFNSLQPRNILIQLLIILSILMIITITYRNRRIERLVPSNVVGSGGGSIEGFAQQDAFLLKQNDNIYDVFYAEVYDTLHKTTSRSKWELKTLLSLTEADTQNSVILDIGSGTGYKLNELQNAGYKVFGIEQSEAMKKESEKKYPEILVNNNNVLDPMNYEKHSFTHVLCLYFTIYEIQNKAAFFRNCHLWMKPSGYLLVHLVDPALFNAIIPAGKPSQTSNTSKRETDTLVKFYDFTYKAKYQFPADSHNSNIVILKETFTDNATKNIRENEQTLYMENINTILKIANREGFIFHGKINMKEYNGDENQFIYVLERMV